MLPGLNAARLRGDMNSAHMTIVNAVKPLYELVDSFMLWENLRWGWERDNINMSSLFGPWIKQATLCSAANRTAFTHARHLFMPLHPASHIRDIPLYLTDQHFNGEIRHRIAEMHYFLFCFSRGSLKMFTLNFLFTWSGEEAGITPRIPSRPLDHPA